ncbi:hypothetical protein [Pedococcus sp. P5_B7]
MNKHLYAIEARKRSRRRLSVADLAAHLDHRLYGQPAVPGATRQGCAKAAQAGFAAVICRPERVAEAARELSGTAVAVVTAVCWDTPGTTHLDTDSMLSQALTLADHGANEVALLATKERMAPSGAEFERQINALVACMGKRDVRVRVILDTEYLTRHDIATACRQATDAGVWMAQGGSWRGPRTGFTQVEAMRDSLGADVLLKWTQPVRSLQTLLLCIAEGVERFNGDVDQLMAAARRSAAAGPMIVPLPRTDY